MLLLPRERFRQRRFNRRLIADTGNLLAVGENEPVALVHRLVASRGLAQGIGWIQVVSFRERYPGPWTIEESGESVRVVARDGTVLAYIYFEDDLPTRRATGKRVTRAEAWALAKAIVGLGR